MDAPRDELEKSDFKPFKRLNHLPAAMTAHIVYTAVDANAPASTSQVLIEDIVRKHIGFDGLLMSDDLSMQALDGAMNERTRAVLDAGCDLALHCNGDLKEMKLVAANAQPLAGDALRRYQAALSLIREVPPAPDRAETEKLQELLAQYE